MKRKEHLNWLKTRGNQEDFVRSSNGNKSKFIIIPSPMDAMFGRGRPIQSHVKNVRLSHLIEQENVEAPYTTGW
jgi:hypothetical protein